jgi:hypothetical protein
MILASSSSFHRVSNASCLKLISLNGGAASPSSSMNFSSGYAQFGLQASSIHQSSRKWPQTMLSVHDIQCMASATNLQAWCPLHYLHRATHKNTNQDSVHVTRFLHLCATFRRDGAPSILQKVKIQLTLRLRGLKSVDLTSCKVCKGQGASKVPHHFVNLQQ